MIDQKIVIEPPRFGITGAGIMAGCIRMDLDAMENAQTYCIDAPRYIACGAVSSTEQDGGLTYLATTVSRE